MIILIIQKNQFIKNLSKLDIYPDMQQIDEKEYYSLNPVDPTMTLLDQFQNILNNHFYGVATL